LEFHQGYCLPEVDELPPGSLGVGMRDEYEVFTDVFEEEFLGGIHQFFGRPRYSTPPPGQQLLASFGEVNDRYLYYIPDPRGGALDLSAVTVVYECT
jgi:hypothetical protein